MLLIYRILESSNPEKFKKIQQINQLQVDLIHKNDMINELNNKILQEEKNYENLKNILARQPILGKETNEQILSYQQSIKEKSKQLNEMDDEMKLYREQIQILKRELSRGNKKIEKIKKQWFHKKKVEEQGNTSSNISMIHPESEDEVDDNTNINIEPL